MNKKNTTYPKIIESFGHTKINNNYNSSPLNLRSLALSTPNPKKLNWPKKKKIDVPVHAHSLSALYSESMCRTNHILECREPGSRQKNFCAQKKRKEL